jgi:hypothetical protein
MLISFAPTHVNMIATPVKLDHIDSVAGCDPLQILASSRLAILRESGMRFDLSMLKFS